MGLGWLGLGGLGWLGLDDNGRVFFEQLATCRPLKLGVAFQVRDIKEVDSEKHRLTMEALLSMTWLDPRAKCKNQVYFE